MSRTKFLTDLDGELAENVKTLLFEIGAIRTCPCHEDILIDNYIGDECRLAEENSLYKELIDESISQEEFEHMVEKIMSITSDSCPYCV